MLRRPLPLPILSILLILLTITSLPAGAATFSVTNLDDSGAGSLRQAILDANNAAGDDTIVFQAGLGGILLTSGRFTITGNLTLNGPGMGLTLNGNNAARIFTVNSGVTATLSALKLQNGGIANDGTLTLNNSTIQSSIWARRPGAAISNSGTLTVNNCTLSGNSTTNDWGGGIYNSDSGRITVNNSTLSGNSAQSGGGISNLGALTVNNCTLSGNSATGAGGGIQIVGSSATVTVTNTTLSGNSAQNGGGGIYLYSGGVLAIRNSTLSGNSVLSSYYGGGGIHIWDGSVTVLDSTLSGNTASSSQGGGIYLYGGVLSAGNTLVAGNASLTGKEIYNDGTFTSLGHNLFGENGSSGLVDANPIASDIILAGAIATAIGPLANNGGRTQTHLLVPGSPAINAGYNALIPVGVTTDQRGTGYDRIVSGTVDIGAVEGFTPPSTTGGASFSVLNNASRTTAYAAGLNNLGQLGAGATTPSSTGQVSPQVFGGRRIYPVRVRSTRATRAVAAETAAPLAVDTTDFIALASGATHTLALHTDGSVWAWGNNANGQLGNGATTNADQPTAVLVNASTPLTGVIALAAGRDHSVAVKNDGTVWTWGRNQYGQLGDNSDATTTRLYPVQVVIDAALTPLDKVRLVAASDVHTVALKTDGTVWAWGDNARGELGTGNTTAQRTAVQVLVLDDAQAILARGTDQSARTIAQRSDGSLWGWGDNRDCQLGEAAPGTAVLTPTRLTNLTNLGVSASNLAQGDAHGLARKRDGTAWSWGNNAQGQLGDGTTTASCTPVQITGLSDVETVGAGVAHSFATTGDGSVWGWGSNNEGQLGVGNDLTPHPTPTRMLGENGVGYLNLKATLPGRYTRRYLRRRL